MAYRNTSPTRRHGLRTESRERARTGTFGPHHHVESPTFSRELFRPAGRRAVVASRPIRRGGPTMKIACVGGGPGGLWFAIGAKLLDPTHEITVLERRPPHSTYGWGIVYWHSLLEGVRQVDPATARQIAGGSVRWAGQRVVVQDKPPVHLGGTGFSMNRRRLIDMLAQRAQALGVRIEHEHEVADLSVASEADLVVLADGANSRLRRSRATSFG